jgi:hypothetical protein
MTIVTIKNLDNTINTVEMTVEKTWNDWHQYVPTNRDRVEEKSMMIRDQKNGMRVVDAQGKFTTATKGEKMTLIDIFNESQEMHITKREGVYRSAMSSIEDCWLYEQLSSTVFDENSMVFVDTDVPRRKVTYGDGTEAIENHRVQVHSLDQYVQKAEAYQLREHSIGASRTSGDWEEWHMAATLYQEEQLRDLGFSDEAINEARAVVQAELPISGTHWTCTFQVWDVLMADERALWALDALADSYENKVAPHTKGATEYVRLFTSRDGMMDKITSFIDRYVAHRVEQAEPLKDQEEDAWFNFMCEGVKYVQDRVQREIGARYTNNKTLWVEFMKWTQNSYWQGYRKLTMANKARFECKPSDEQRKAIGMFMWLESLMFENEMNAQDEHIDNWTENREYQQSERQAAEFDNMWELELLVRGE